MTEKEQVASVPIMSLEEKRRKKEEIRATLAAVRGEQDTEDYDAYIHRDENARQSIAITDILLSGKLPFLVKNNENNSTVHKGKPKSPKALLFSPNQTNNLHFVPPSPSSQSVAGASVCSSQVSAPNSVGSFPKKAEKSAGNRIRTISQDLQSTNSGVSSQNASTTVSTRFPSVKKSRPRTKSTDSDVQDMRKTLAESRKFDEYELLVQAEAAISHGGLIDGIIPGGTVASNKFHSLMTNFTKNLPKVDARMTADGRLQYVLEQLNKVKTDLDPSKIYFEAGMIFYEMNVMERAVVCLEKATKASDVVRIVDTLYLPNDVNYQRKVERMSPTMLPKFLADRKALRDRLLFEESDKQRLRVQAAHCELCRMRCLVPTVRDLWKAHGHIEQAFALSHSQDEHYEMLRYFHRLIVAFTEEVLQEQHTEFTREQQIIRGSAGPLSDAHVTILLELEKFEPENAVYQEWLGRRFTEKCLFEEAAHHYETARELRRHRPTRAEVIQLWRKKPQQAEGQAEEIAALIRRNVHKSVLQEYQNFDGDVYNLAQEEATKDLSHFPGKHDHMRTVLYLPPPQGWTGQT